MGAYNYILCSYHKSSMQIGLLKTLNDDDYEIFSFTLILTFRFSHY